MGRFAGLLFLLCVGCSHRQPESAKASAALEVPLVASKDRSTFLIFLSEKSKAYGYHLDAASDAELRQLSSVSKITMDAAIWKGNDEEVVASAMDSEDHLGRVWLIFFHGTQPYKNAQFRIALTSEIHQFWPAARSLPIMPDGAIPNVSDLIRTPSGYVVNPTAASAYNALGANGA